MQDIDGCIDLTAEETVFEIDKEDFLFFDEIISANENHELNNGLVVHLSIPQHCAPETLDLWS